MIALPVASLARMYEPPRSFSMADKDLASVERRVLAPIDRERLLAEDRERAKPGRREPGPDRFAVAETVSFDLRTSGTWQALPDGRLWRLRVHTPGAVSHNLGITRFDLPEGAKFWVYDRSGERVEGPYTSRHRSHRGSLWTPIIEGDEIVIELFVPTAARHPALLVGQVNKGYRTVGKGGGAKSHGACNNDVICPEGDPWRDQIRSVARYTINGTSLCSGQLMNNTSADFTPYFLSANHCGVTSDNDDTLVFFWNFEAPNCGDQGGGSLADNQTGAIFRAASAPSDFVLVELSADPDPSFDVFFSGWDASGAVAASTTGIHHPRGDVKSISFNTNAVTSTAYYSNTVSATANHWRVDDWEDGTTEGGSSGSCLWDTGTGRCLGQLHGGDASCAAATSPDWYGKLSTSWTGGGTAATRLRDWLDPGNTGALSLDGDPHVTTLDGTRYDFQGAGEFVVLRDADAGAEIQVRQAPIATTFDPGPDPYSGLATCVSLNSGVAARVGARRVTYQPNLSGRPDPSGLQLRVDGKLTRLGPAGIDLGNGGRLAPTAALGGLEITFPEKYVLRVTPGWWASQGHWYLNLGVTAAPGRPALSGASPGRGPAVGGIGAPIAPRSWLPALPDGSTVGPMPVDLHDRYVALYEKFGEAWRVEPATSLFDYAPATSAATFTPASWPGEKPPCRLPNARPATPLDVAVAERHCAKVGDPKARANCVFDVRVTGEPEFARTYMLSERVARSATVVRVFEEVGRARGGAGVFTAVVARSGGSGAEIGGAVQFLIDGRPAGKPIPLDERGRATWQAEGLPPGARRITAAFVPSSKSELASSSSAAALYEVSEKY